MRRKKNPDLMTEVTEAIDLHRSAQNSVPHSNGTLKGLYSIITNVLLRMHYELITKGSTSILETVNSHLWSLIDQGGTHEQGRDSRKISSQVEA